MLQNRNICFIIRTIFYNEPITLREVSRVARCSVSKTSRSIKKLIAKDMVSVEVKGRSYLISTSLNNPLVKYAILQEETGYTKLTFSRYPELFEKLKDIDGKILLIFGSHAEHNADDLSDVDILTIDGNGPFNVSSKKIKKMLEIVLFMDIPRKEEIGQIKSAIELIDNRLSRWREYWIPYKDLNDKVKEQDRKWARKIIGL